VAAISTSVYATVYLSAEQARQTIFPGGVFIEESVSLTDEQAREIARRAGIAPARKAMQVWKEQGGGLFFVDQVVGKHDYITYAVGLNPDGSVKQVEIMEYRESYGYEVRNLRWRNQFVGKTSASPLRLDEDIRNISGATLSCRHVTEGVKRILATYDVALRK
jgi:Na+-translocating ferredoxin:NAD+ oxidoreductase RnfG subunit